MNLEETSGDCADTVVDDNAGSYVRFCTGGIGEISISLQINSQEASFL
jgi:hypothetical protein